MTKGSVSLADIYAVVNRLEDKFDDKLEKLEARTTILEDFRGRALGILSIIVVVASAVFTWAWSKFTKTI